MTRSTVTIGPLHIGPGHPCAVIAEIGINHNGSVEIAKQLIDAAVAAGCAGVKFQKRTVGVVYSPEDLAKPRQIPPDNGIMQRAVERGVLSPAARDRLVSSGYETTTNGDLKWALEFTKDEYREIVEHTGQLGILCFASPWDEASVDFLEGIQTPCYKIPSARVTAHALLERIRATHKPVILSTGMSTLKEVEAAVEILGEKNLIILHCVSTYPSQDDDLNLGVIKTLAERFPGVPIGYSGHEKGILHSTVAVGMGACMIERHLTLDRRMWGTDQAASIEPAEFAVLVADVRRVERALGDGGKRILPGERPIREKLAMHLRYY